MSTQTLNGQCLCGAVSITVHGKHVPQPGACHCRMCRKWSGGLFLCFAAAPSAVAVDGEVARFASSDFAERAFCPRCGSHLWMRNTGSEEDDYELMPGLFDAARDWPLRSEIYTDQALASVRLGGDHPRATSDQYEAKNRHVEGETQ